MFPVFADRAGFNLSNEDTVHFNFDGSDFRKPQSTAFNPESRLLGIGNAVVSAFSFESRIAWFIRFIRQPPEKSLICALHTEQDVLQYLGMDPMQ